MHTQIKVRGIHALIRGGVAELCSASLSLKESGRQSIVLPAVTSFGPRDAANHSQFTRAHARRMGIVLAIAVLALSGCGRGERRVPVFKTSGSVVRADGSAVPNALVVLHATGAASTVPKPRGTTDEQGRFQLTTYEVDDGAPEGQFTITVEQWIRDDPNLPPSNHLVATLAKPESSGLQATISQGINEIPSLTVQNK